MRNGHHRRQAVAPSFYSDEPAIVYVVVTGISKASSAKPG